jgi:hypothetical protein
MAPIHQSEGRKWYRSAIQEAEMVSIRLSGRAIVGTLKICTIRPQSRPSICTRRHVLSCRRWDMLTFPYGGNCGGCLFYTRVTSLSLSLILSLSLSLSLFLSLTLSVCLALSLFVSLAHSMSVSRTHFLSLSVSRSVSLSLSFSRSLTLSVCLARSLFLSLARSLCLSRSCSLLLTLSLPVSMAGVGEAAVGGNEDQGGVSPPPALKAGSNPLFRSLICTGARWNSAARGTSQGN